MVGKITKSEKPKKDTNELQYILFSSCSVLSFPFKMNKMSMMIWKRHLGKIMRVYIEGLGHPNGCLDAVDEAFGKVQVRLFHPVLWATKIKSQMTCLMVFKTVTSLIYLGVLSLSP